MSSPTSAGSTSAGNRWILPVLRALRFHDAAPDELSAIRPERWPEIVRRLDNARLTLPLGIRCREHLPPEVRERINANLKNNALRHSRIEAACQEIDHAFQSGGVDFVFLKGITQWPYFTDDPAHRPQYDIDVFCPPPSIPAARRLAASLGYQPARQTDTSRIDHLPILVRTMTGWRWRGDYFDPDMPLLLELHFRFWDEETEAIDAGALNHFWKARTLRPAPLQPVPALSLLDGLAYSALHLVRHLFRGDLKPWHVYEIAHFLDRTAGEDVFWKEWDETTPPKLKSLQAVAFRLAVEWFRPALAGRVVKAMESLPGPVSRWFDLFGLSPAIGLEAPNKDELWLHLSLITGFRDRVRVAARRLIPRRAGRWVAGVTPAAPSGLGQFLEQLRLERAHLAARAAHHCRAIPSIARNAWLWRNELRRLRHTDSITSQTSA